MILPYIWRYLVNIFREADQKTFFGTMYIGMTSGIPVTIAVALLPFSLIPLPFVCIFDGLVYLYRQRKAREIAKRNRILAEFKAMSDRWSAEALARIEVERERDRLLEDVKYFETAIAEVKRPKKAALQDVVDSVSKDHAETLEVLQTLPIHPADKQSLIFAEEDRLLDRIRNVLRNRDKR